MGTLVAGLTLSGCGHAGHAAASGTTPARSGASCQWSKPMGSRGVAALSYCFTLHQGTLTAGTTAQAFLKIRNTSGHEIAFADGPAGSGCAIQTQVDLRGDHLNIEPIAPLDCVQPRMLTTGVTTVKVPVVAGYATCTTPDRATTSTPTCVRPGVPPPLPTGAYTVSLVASAGDPFAHVAPVRVQLIK